MAIFTLTSPIDINLPTRSALVPVTKDYLVSLVINFKNKNNVSPMSQRFHGPIYFFYIFQVTFLQQKWKLCSIYMRIQSISYEKMKTKVNLQKYHFQVCRSCWLVCGS